MLSEKWIGKVKVRVGIGRYVDFFEYMKDKWRVPGWVSNNDDRLFNDEKVKVHVRNPMLPDSEALIVFFSDWPDQKLIHDDFKGMQRIVQDKEVADELLHYGYKLGPRIERVSSEKAKIANNPVRIKQRPNDLS